MNSNDGRRAGALAATALIVGLAGCAVGPDYKRPSAAVPPAYASDTNSFGTNEWKIAEPRANLPKGKWWEIFQDAQLNGLEADAATSNQDLKAAVAVFEQARAFVDINRSGLFPHVAFAPSYTRERDSANRPINGISNGLPDTYNNFTVPLDASYEVDVWGRVRRTVEAARTAAQASADDVEATRLSIQAELATDYFTLRALDAELALLRSSVEVFQKSYDLTRNRRAGGVATDLDVAQAETVLKTTEAQLPVTLLERTKVEHALAVLTGRPASSFDLPEKTLTLAPPILPAGVPSELLERRPDIASAERRMASANANIGVAKAAFYPRIQLSGLAGYQSVSAGTAFDWPSHIWAFGPSVTFPLFEGGQLRAELKRTQAVYDEVVAQYRQNVLNAFAEVEDNLAGQRLLAVENEAEAAALQSAEKTLDIANNRYRAGLVTYLEVATAENAALDLQRTAVRLHGDQLVTTVALIKSLGGTWQVPPKQL
ncbi:MAG TPA: efflux transporter outer membrane subunit [Verrucomicrobiae bacterium]|jgi:multidrug efflux system outer membrane protein|nr:efflux transporter outer membrane subunit [Verrucomicrobiae bacterium]